MAPKKHRGVLALAEPGTTRKDVRKVSPAETAATGKVEVDGPSEGLETTEGTTK